MNFSCPNPYGMSQINPMMGSGYGMTPIMGNGMGMKPLDNSGINSIPLNYYSISINGNTNCFNDNYTKTKKRFKNSKKKEMYEDD